MAEALEHLDFAIREFRDMKMQPSLKRALKHKWILGRSSVPEVTFSQNVTICGSVRNR